MSEMLKNRVDISIEANRRCGKQRLLVVECFHSYLRGGYFPSRLNFQKETQYFESLRNVIEAVIEIDIPEKKLNVKLPEDEIRQRLAELPEFEPKIKSGYLARYATMVSSADKGAVFPR